MDAIQYLRQEHAAFREALAAISKMSNETMTLKKFKAFTADLSKHETMEQKIWYPVLRKNPEMKELIQHLVDEEKAASRAIKKLLDSSYGIIWRLRFYKFKHDVDHHAKTEEKELFPLARKHLSKQELMALGKKMQAYKASLKKES